MTLKDNSFPLKVTFCGKVKRVPTVSISRLFCLPFALLLYFVFDAVPCETKDYIETNYSQAVYSTLREKWIYEESKISVRKKKISPLLNNFKSKLLANTAEEVRILPSCWL